MGTSKFLKPKSPQDIVKDLLKDGEIGEKYAILVQLFNKYIGKIFDEMADRGIDKEEFVDAYISQWGDFRRESNEDKVHWLLNDILHDHIDEITDEMINNALEK